MTARIEDDRLEKYRAGIRRTLQGMSDRALQFQDGIVRGGIDRQELDLEINRRLYSKAGQ